MTNTAAQIIAQQIGSGLAMIGAKDLVGSADSLRFKIGRGAQKGITHIAVNLASDDTYTVTAQKYSPRNLTVDTVAKVDGVYADMLRSTIGRMTGFAMSL
jgi:hypothetical protein